MRYGALSSTPLVKNGSVFEKLTTKAYRVNWLECIFQMRTFIFEMYLCAKFLSLPNVSELLLVCSEIFYTRIETISSQKCM